MNTCKAGCAGGGGRGGRGEEGERTVVRRDAGQAEGRSCSSWVAPSSHPLSWTPQNFQCEQSHDPY